MFEDEELKEFLDLEEEDDDMGVEDPFDTPIFIDPEYEEDDYDW